MTITYSKVDVIKLHHQEMVFLAGCGRLRQLTANCTVPAVVYGLVRLVRFAARCAEPVRFAARQTEPMHFAGFAVYNIFNKYF